MPQAKKSANKRPVPRRPARSPVAARISLEQLSSLSETISIRLQRQICHDLARRLEQTAACDEFLQVLRATVTRLHKRTRGPSEPALAAQIYDTILEQYNRLLNGRPPAPRRRSRT